MSVSVSNIEELRKIMKATDIDPDYYSIYPDDNFFCDTVSYINPKKEGWEIGVFERGSTHHVRRFIDESKACQAFLEDLFPEVLTDEK